MSKQDIDLFLDTIRTVRSEKRAGRISEQDAEVLYKMIAALFVQAQVEEALWVADSKITEKLDAIDHHIMEEAAISLNAMYASS